MDRHIPSGREILLYLDSDSHGRGPRHPRRWGINVINDHRTVPPSDGTFSRDIPPQMRVPEADRATHSKTPHVRTQVGH